MCVCVCVCVCDYLNLNEYISIILINSSIKKMDAYKYELFIC